MNLDNKWHKRYLDVAKQVASWSKDPSRKIGSVIVGKAVSDYIPKEKFDGKLKKEKLGETWSLELSKNIDILANLDKKDIFSIGFKAEMDKKEAKSNAQNMLKNKNLDAVCLNILDESNVFGSDTNKIKLLLKDKSFDFYGNKLNISLEILNRFEKEFTNE